jgi:hypothetical protein
MPTNDSPPVLADGSTPVTGVLTATGAGAIRMPIYDTGGTVHNLRASATVGGLDDAPAIQAWYDALPAGAHALIPSGEYRIGTGLAFNRMDVNVGFVGTFLYTGNGATPAVTLGTTTAGATFVAPLYSGHLSIRRASIGGGPRGRAHPRFSATP